MPAKGGCRFRRAQREIEKDNAKEAGTEFGIRNVRRRSLEEGLLELVARKPARLLGDLPPPRGMAYDRALCKCRLLGSISYRRSFPDRPGYGYHQQ